MAMAREKVLRRQFGNRALLAAALVVLAVQASHAGPDVAATTAQGAPAKTIIDLQPLRETAEATILPSGAPVRLTTLAPASNAWFLLEIGSGDRAASYHIENPDPAGRRLTLAADPAALVTADAGGTERCAPWEGSPAPLDAARISGLPYAPICGGRLYLRNRVAGSRTSLERMTDFLRDNVWQGESIVGFVKKTFYKDAFLESGTAVPSGSAPALADAPAPARIAPDFAGEALVPADFGIGLEDAPGGRMVPGAWYAVSALPGVFVSVIAPKMIAAEVLNGPGRTAPLDSVESGALDFMVAFDLARFDLGYELGTDHPRLGWSDRVPQGARDDRLPGPDGIDSPAPLVTTGMVSPAVAGRIVAAFTGGFKREHGAFKYGALATRNHGSHYGFVEQGVVFSRLNPDLATLYVLDDGTVGMKTWAAADDALLPRLRFARQNGVPLLETDPATGTSVPGALVTRWGAGNWSGSADEKLRTLRASACLREAEGRRFLVYGYFSAATPSAMARAFEAYGCRYAMQLDINALEHTYLALYVRKGGALHVEHLIPGMDAVDKADAAGAPIPRFLGFPDNRDFFYLVPREGNS